LAAGLAGLRRRARADAPSESESAGGLATGCVTRASARGEEGVSDMDGDGEAGA
jgi:hypothetical protein